MPDPPARVFFAGLLWFVSLCFPPIVYVATFAQTFAQDNRPKGQQAALGVGAGFVLPFLISWQMEGYSSGFFCLFYAAAILIGHPIYKFLRDSEREHQRQLAEKARLREEALELERLRGNIASLPTTDEFLAMFNVAFALRCKQEGLPEPGANATLYSSIVRELYEQDIIRPRYVMPTLLTEALTRYGDVAKLLNGFQEPLLNCFMEFRRRVPPKPSPFNVPAYELVDLSTIAAVLGVFPWDGRIAHEALIETFRKNALDVGMRQLKPRRPEDQKHLWPLDFEGTVAEAAYAYFSDTPLLKLFTASMPVAFPDQARFQHQWVVAPTGSGKTQLLQTQILADIEKVKNGEASLIIMDSQGMAEGKFLSNVARLKVFAKGQPLEGKLVVLQPDPDFPLALNLFDMGQHDPLLSSRDRQILHMSALKMITFCLAGTTDQQQDMIEYLVQLAMAVPNASIATVRRMLAIKNLKEFETEFHEALAATDETVREYFLHSYFGQGQGGIQATTREAVLRRIMGMLRNPVFRKMYQNERNKFSMLREIEAGKVIVINTDIELMGKEACELFGRFFISLLVQATQQRKSTKPVYCYIDECQDYIARDDNVADLLDKARKQHVGLILAHQRLANITSPNVLDALSNVAIKFAGGNVTDASTLSRYMRATPEFVADQPALSFAAFIRGQTPAAIKISVKYGEMEAMERMTDDEYAEVERDMRERYTTVSIETTPAPTPTLKRGAVTDAEWEDVV